MVWMEERQLPSRESRLVAMGSVAGGLLMGGTLASKALLLASASGAYVLRPEPKWRAPNRASDISFRPDALQPRIFLALPVASPAASRASRLTCRLRMVDDGQVPCSDVLMRHTHVLRACSLCIRDLQCTSICMVDAEQVG